MTSLGSGGIPSILELIRQHAKAGLSLDKEGMAANAKVCEVIKEYQRQKCIDLVLTSGGRPCLYSYQSDGTPILGKITWTQGVGQKKRVRRGGHAMEFLIEKAFLRGWTASGDPRTAVLLRDPRVLDDGKKTAWHMFSVAQTFSHRFARLDIRESPSPITLSTEGSTRRSVPSCDSSIWLLLLLLLRLRLPLVSLENSGSRSS